MWMDWDETNTNNGGEPKIADKPKFAPPAGRFDMLLPADEETLAVDEKAASIYLRAMIDMVGRTQQPLTLACVAADELPLISFLGPDATALIGKAMVRCMRQETRDYDVVSRLHVPGMPLVFIITCPMQGEDKVKQLTHRLQLAMTAVSPRGEAPWLSVSAGIASLSLDASDAESLRSRAVAALRRGRASGPGTLWTHGDTLNMLIAEDSNPQE